MIDLDKVTLTGPLSFEVPTDPQDHRKLGICVVEESRDEKVRRFHIFSTQDGVYKGFYDKYADTGFLKGKLEIAYKRQNAAKEHMYIVRRLEMHERMVQIGEPEVVPEESLPKIEADEQNRVHLINGDKLEHIDPPETSLERLEAESNTMNRGIAELTDTSGYLKDTPSEAAERAARKPQEVIRPVVPPAEAPQEVEPDTKPEGDGEPEEGTNQRRMIY